MNNSMSFHTWPCTIKRQSLDWFCSNRYRTTQHREAYNEQKCLEEGELDEGEELLGQGKGPVGPGGGIVGTRKRTGWTRERKSWDEEKD